MRDTQVFVVRCPDYDHVEDRMTELLTMMGGMGSFAASGERIVLKVNLLQPVKPKKAVTTHPAVVAAVHAATPVPSVHANTLDDTGNEHAHIDDETCIRCYCCHEICPEGAVELHESLLYRLGNR